MEVGAGNSACCCIFNPGNCRDDSVFGCSNTISNSLKLDVKIVKQDRLTGLLLMLSVHTFALFY